MIHLSPIDGAIIALFLAAVVYVGFRSARKTSTSEEDYLLAGRSLTLPIFVMTLVSTWYGGILGVGEFSYRYGLANWFTQALPYYVFAAVFALVLAKKIRATNLFTIPDKLEAAYDRKTALLGSVLTFILMTPAPYILMLSVFLQMLFGWSLAVSLLVTAAVAISYLYWGGFRSDVHTDVLEFILMFIGFAVIVPFCVSQYGGFEFLRSNLPPLHLTWHGGRSTQYILVWFFIALWTLVDPAFYQRCYAAKDGGVAQKGILVSMIFWFIFDSMTMMAGLYSRAIVPHLSEPMMTYPMLAETVLPPVAKGLFYVGMLATIMSTLNTLAFVSAQTLGRDIALRLAIRDWSSKSKIQNPCLSGRQAKSKIFDLQSPIPNRQPLLSTGLTKIGLIVSFLLSIMLALAIPSVINLWYTIGTVVIPGLLVPLIASYFDSLRMPTPFAFLAMLFGWLTSLVWFLMGDLHAETAYPLGIEPMYPGLLVSILLWFFGRIELVSSEKLSR